MTEPIHKFLAMPSDDQLLYMVGRRAGIFSRLDDLTDTELAGHAEEVRTAYRVTKDNYNAFTAEMVKRFI